MLANPLAVLSLVNAQMHDDDAEVCGESARCKQVVGDDALTLGRFLRFLRCC
ncbi:MAG: hypothetical protein ACXVZR_11920 [Terriglobales bacterium]